MATIGLLAATGHGFRVGPAATVSSTTSPLAPISAPAPGLPKFYVVVYNTFVGSKIPTIAAVHDSVTGKTLTRVQVPTLYCGGADGPGISAAADNRTYVITEIGDSTKPQCLVLSRPGSPPNGHSATVRKLPIAWPKTLSADVAAISPDGTRLAVAEQDCGRSRCQYTGVRVITIATGAVRTWTTSANGAPFQVSWAGNSRIAFEWQSSSKRQARPLVPRTGYSMSVAPAAICCRAPSSRLRGRWLRAPCPPRSLRRMAAGRSRRHSPAGRMGREPGPWCPGRSS